MSSLLLLCTQHTETNIPHTPLDLPASQQQSSQVEIGVKYYFLVRSRLKREHNRVNVGFPGSNPYAAVTPWCEQKKQKEKQNTRIRTAWKTNIYPKIHKVFIRRKQIKKCNTDV